MARYTVLYWQSIPTVVEARDESGSHKIELSERFQQLVDRVAMRSKLAGTDAYLSCWRKGRAKSRSGSASEVARAVAEQLESSFEQIAAEALGRNRDS